MADGHPAPPLWMNCVPKQVYIWLTSYQLPHNSLQGFNMLQDMFCPADIQYKTNQVLTLKPLRDRSGRRRPAQDHAFIAYWCVRVGRGVNEDERTLSLSNTPLRLTVSSLWSSLVSSRFVLASWAWLRPVGPQSGRLVMAQSSEPQS